ncbi:hypothetical protein [Lederbergia lenta]|uniref:hypothetical protein n=1 Tax=Lederbergia lenta TaxID=1467 RepID=UPI0011AE6DFD|nr:hypothetical protein [Lederbergia lenta]MCM3110760.1 hypothetical protein [Lederbergia lenta]MEC2325844.1 hypothetical protein [Lederbergia lenta]
MKRTSSFLQYLIMKMFILKIYSSDSDSITFDYPINSEVNSEIISFIETIFDSVEIKGKVLRLTDLKPDILEELKILIKKNQLPEPYNILCSYIKNLERNDFKDEETPPTIISGYLNPLNINLELRENEWNDYIQNSELSNSERTPILIIAPGQWQEEEKKISEFDFVLQEIVNEYCLFSKDAGEDYTLLVPLPNIKYTSELENYIKNIFFSYFKQVGIVTSFYMNSLYLTAIQLKSPFRIKKVTLDNLLIG